ncbi:MAG: ChbG/HpnK family deacetylase [Candidatus Hydrogenedens sp.]|nr:ChbG/HpnK family deacetylase [Candidatus Hydrogenedens sp.]
MWKLTLAALLAAGVAAAAEPSLVERLGFEPDARLLIVNGDDFGMNQATNTGTEKAYKGGGLTSATIMVTCPWFLQAVDFAKNHPVSAGVHTVLTSEWKYYKWGPVVGAEAAPSLVDKLGFFYEDVPAVYLNADIVQVGHEIRAQVKRALDAGLDATHIDSHMGAMQYAPGYHKLYIDIAKEFNLPCRIASREMMAQFNAEDLVDYADENGVLHCEELIMDGPKDTSMEGTEQYWKDVMSKIPAGKVTEILIHCGQMTPEMQDTTGTAARRTADAEFFALPETREWMIAQGIEPISYRELRHLQREGKPMPRVERYGWE